MDERELIPQLYRQEYSKMVSLLCNRFGIDQMDAAEDIVSETFLSAAETWGLKGVPDNPRAWLYAVARNNALNGLRHEQVFQKKVKGELLRRGAGSVGGTGSGMDGGWVEPDWDLSPVGISDSQLRMLFAVCHPAIPLEAQVSLALRVLCGFTIEEIAQALLTTKANINKRLYRAKEKLRSEGVRLDLPAGAAFESRLDAVLLTLYLLFNEGYYSASPSMVLRKDLCFEAMRLVYLLADGGGAGAEDVGGVEGVGGQGRVVRADGARGGGAGVEGDGGAGCGAGGAEDVGGAEGTRGGDGARGGVRADVYSLLALMCFQASRFDARIDPTGGLVLYEQQDSARWDQELVRRGYYFFGQACDKGLLSRYHFEAAIAWWHTQPKDSAEKWENILSLYNRLLILEYSPIAALNRAYAFSRVYGKEEAIPEAERLGLDGNPFYHSLLGELYSEVDGRKAVVHFERALELLGSDAEKAVIAGKLAACGKI